MGTHQRNVAVQPAPSFLLQRENRPTAQTGVIDLEHASHQDAPGPEHTLPQASSENADASRLRADQPP